MALVEITKEEAALLPLLYKIPLSTNLEAAAQVMKNKMIVDGLIKKVKAALEAPPPPDTTQPEPQPSQQPRRRRR